MFETTCWKESCLQVKQYYFDLELDYLSSIWTKFILSGPIDTVIAVRAFKIRLDEQDQHAISSDLFDNLQGLLDNMDDMMALIKNSVFADLLPINIREHINSIPNLENQLKKYKCINIKGF